MSIEPAYRATEEILAEYPNAPGCFYVYAPAGAFLTVDEAEHLGLVEAPAVRTAKVEAPRAARRR